MRRSIAVLLGAALLVAGCEPEVVSPTPLTEQLESQGFDDEPPPAPPEPERPEAPPIPPEVAAQRAEVDEACAALTAEVRELTLTADREATPEEQLALLEDTMRSVRDGWLEAAEQLEELAEVDPLSEGLAEKVRATTTELTETVRGARQRDPMAFREHLERSIIESRRVPTAAVNAGLTSCFPSGLVLPKVEEVAQTLEEEAEGDDAADAEEAADGEEAPEAELIDDGEDVDGE